MANKPRLKPINQELLLERMKFENPWWLNGSIDPDYKQMQRRLYFDLFYPLVTETEIKRAVVLMGPRRVGKTVMMHHAIDQLLQGKADRDRICFLGIDNPIYLNRGLEELFKLAREAAGNMDPNGWTVFFDEIQYLKNWEQHLKVMVDSYPHTKFVVSGSAAAALKVKSQESGAGRFTEFLLPPLTFHEYIHLKGHDNLIKKRMVVLDDEEITVPTTTNIAELNRHFIDYINFGGYPELIFSERMQANPGRYIKSDIIDKVLLRDLPSIYGIQDVQELNSFFSTLAYYSGNEVSLDVLSKSSGVDKNLLKKYLEYLEAAFLIKVVHRIDDNAKRFQRAVFFKVYLTNPSLRSALFSPLQATDEAFGSMVETVIYAQWFHQENFTPWYARWSVGRFQGEVDMVHLDSGNFKPTWALEVKWSNRYYTNPKELKSLLSFCKRHGFHSTVVTSIDKEGIVEWDGIAISFHPSAIYAYIIGYNTIEDKKAKNAIL